MRISFAITVCQEFIELEQLLAQLAKFPVDNSEVVILTDAGNTHDKVHRVIKKYSELIPNVSVHEHSLNRDFSTHKNFLNKQCKGDWIFAIDADEIPSSELLKVLHDLLDENENDVQAMWVPRINIVQGLTKQQAKEWGWYIDDKDYVNFPDWQMRIYKNSPEIRWEGRVHEKVTGFTEYGYFPQDDRFALLHVKEIDKQKAQNMFYDTIQR